MKPNKVNIRKWVDALRSGKFRQGKGDLRVQGKGRHYKYCCLGVACAISGAPLDEWSEGRDLGASPETQKWLGINSENPMLNDSSAIGMNDDEGATFKQIADAIEKKYLTPKKRVRA